VLMTGATLISMSVCSPVIAVVWLWWCHGCYCCHGELAIRFCFSIWRYGYGGATISRARRLEMDAYVFGRECFECLELFIFVRGMSRKQPHHPSLGAFRI